MSLNVQPVFIGIRSAENRKVAAYSTEVTGGSIKIIDKLIVRLLAKGRTLSSKRPSVGERKRDRITNDECYIPKNDRAKIHSKTLT